MKKYRICIRYDGETFYSIPFGEDELIKRSQQLKDASIGKLRSYSFINRFGGRSFFPKEVLLRAVMWIRSV
jgi:hypothetical protein